MNFIFKSILDNGPFFKIHLQVIKETTLEAIESNNNETLVNGSILQILGVKSLVKQDILIRLNTTGTGSTLVQDHSITPKSIYSMQHLPNGANCEPKD
jgi:hypothetical protein